MVRALDDDSLLVLYIGPRRTGAEGDRDAAQAIRNILHGVLAELGLWSGARIAMTHCWSDAMDVRDGVSDPLALMAAQSFADGKRAAA